MDVFFSMAKKVHRPGGGGKCRGGVDLGVEGFTALVGQLNRKLLDWEAISSVPTQMILDQKGGGHSLHMMVRYGQHLRCCYFVIGESSTLPLNACMDLFANKFFYQDFPPKQ